MVDYDSSVDTKRHIARLTKLLEEAANELRKRAVTHDQTKLEEPEKTYFDKFTPLLAKIVYGSPEYVELLHELKPALDHHYKHNSHHPQHYSCGVDGMNLFDVMEMFLDWKASSERNNNGSFQNSLEYNVQRFSLSPQLTKIFVNTAQYLGWIEPEEEKQS
jgi:hypothetical protein